MLLVIYCTKSIFCWRIMKPRIFRAFGLMTLFGTCFLAGATVAEMREMNRKETVVSSEVFLESQDWGLGFSEPGQTPTGMATIEELKEYKAYFLGDTSQKKMYLTFDAGYENGNTEVILDALKKHQIKATFFVVGHYLETAPEVVTSKVFNSLCNDSISEIVEYNLF